MNHRLRSVLRELIAACTGGIVIFSLYLGGQSLLSAPHQSSGQGTLRVGTVITGASFANIRHQRTLLIAASGSCSHSLQNLPFHRRLISAATGTDMNIVVLVPDDNSAQFMREKLSAKDIQSTKLSQFGIEGTPAVAVLDSSNRVQHLWTGELPIDLQDIVLAQVESGLHTLSTPDVTHVFFQTATDTNIGDRKSVVLNSSSKTTATVASRASIETLDDKQLTKRLASVSVLDISPRDFLSDVKVRNGTAIPADELKIRASYELDKQASWVLDCSHVDGGVCDMSTYEFVRSGFKLENILDRNAMGATCQTTPTP